MVKTTLESKVGYGIAEHVISVLNYVLLSSGRWPVSVDSWIVALLSTGFKPPCCDAGAVYWVHPWLSAHSSRRLACRTAAGELT